MTKCEITGKKIVYDGIKTVCIADNGAKVVTCYVSPARWDKSRYGYKFKYREQYGVTEYANEEFTDINNLLEFFKQRLPAGIEYPLKKTTRNLYINIGI